MVEELKMKKLFLALLLFGSTYGQVQVVNNTTQLSALEAQGVAIVAARDATSGIYTSIDSTYAEGTYAFDHLYTGQQWARLGAFANSDFIALTVDETSTLTGAVTLGSTLILPNAEIIANSTDGDIIVTFNDDDDSLGQLILRSSIAGTAVEANNHIDIAFEAGDGGSTNTEYAKIIMNINDTTRASEDASIKFNTVVAGTSTLGATITGTAVAVVGAVTAASVTATSTGATTITGSITPTDSTTSMIIKDSATKKWKIRVNTEGILSADSTGLN